jgi:hypothetical protein
MWYVCGRSEVHTWFWWVILMEGFHLEDPGIDGRITLKWVFKKWGGGAWTGLIWVGIGTGEGCCVYGDEPSSFIKCGEFLE